MYNKDTFVKGGEKHMEIGQKIKEARNKKKLTQQELGELIGVQKSAIAKYESGRVVNIKRSTLQKIASALDMRPSELIFESSPKDTANFHVRIISDFELMDALKEYYKLSEDNKRVIRDLIQNLPKE
jgi:transcriptional regulator with XRE-family HTH domain